MFFWLKGDAEREKWRKGNDMMMSREFGGGGGVTTFVAEFTGPFLPFVFIIIAMMLFEKRALHDQRSRCLPSPASPCALIIHFPLFTDGFYLPTRWPGTHKHMSHLDMVVARPTTVSSWSKPKGFLCTLPIICTRVLPVHCILLYTHCISLHTDLQ